MLTLYVPSWSMRCPSAFLSDGDLAIIAATSDPVIAGAAGAPAGACPRCAQIANVSNATKLVAAIIRITMQPPLVLIHKKIRQSTDFPLFFLPPEGLCQPDPEQDATYNSAAPGTKFPRRLHPDTHTLFVVIAGEMHFIIEGQQPLVASRGSIVNILKSTVFSYEMGGTQNALWVEVNPNNYKTVYPSDDPPPPAAPGAEVVKVAFNHTPASYTPPNQVHWNLFEAAAKCEQAGAKVNEDHL